MADEAAVEHLLEGQRLEHVGLGVGRAIGVAALGKAEPGAGDLQRRIDDRLVDDADRGRRLGDAVDFGRDAVGARIARSRRDDLDRLPQRLAGILPDEILQRLGAEAVDENRLVLAEHADVEQFARRLDRDQQIDRRAGKAGDRLEIDRFEGIGDEDVAIVALREDRPDRQGRVALADAEGLGKQRLHRLAVERGRLRAGDESAQAEKRRKQRREARQRGAKPRRTRPIPEHFFLPRTKLFYAGDIAYSTFSQLRAGASGVSRVRRKRRRCRREGKPKKSARKGRAQKSGRWDRCRQGSCAPTVWRASSSPPPAPTAPKPRRATSRPRSPRNWPLPGDNPEEAIVGLVCFVCASYDPATFASEIQRLLPGAPIFGCTTAGELTLSGWASHSVVAIGFLRSNFTLVAQMLEDLSHFGVEEGRASIAEARAALMARIPDGEADRCFGLLLIDGMCRREEAVISALYSALDDIPVVGGSAGDGMSFEKTWMIRDGAVHRDAALLLLFHTDMPFSTFKCDYFEPTSLKMVVTDADTELRVVRELNAEPAAPGIRPSGRVDRKFTRCRVLRVASCAGRRRRAILRPLDPEGERRRLAELLLRDRRGPGADGGQIARPLREHARDLRAHGGGAWRGLALYRLRLRAAPARRRAQPDRPSPVRALPPRIGSSASTPMASNIARCTSTRLSPASRSAIGRTTRSSRHDSAAQRDRRRSETPDRQAGKDQPRPDVARRALGRQPVQRLFAVRDRHRARPSGAPPHPGIAAGDALDRKGQKAGRGGELAEDDFRRPRSATTCCSR